MDIEDRTGQDSFDSQAHAIRNWQYYDEMHHELSINYCRLLLGLSCTKKRGLRAYFKFLLEKGGLLEMGLNRAFTVSIQFNSNLRSNTTPNHAHRHLGHQKTWRCIHQYHP